MKNIDWKAKYKEICKLNDELYSGLGMANSFM